MIDFPNSPTVGQQFTAAGVTWTWDGTKWTGNGLNTPYLPLAGGTLSGPLTLVGNPVAPLQPATKQYVDYIEAAYPLGDNHIINGDMLIDQRGVASGGGGTTSGYTVDRWMYGGNTASPVGTWTRVNSTAMAANGFPSVLMFTSSTAHTSVATDAISFFQCIEADMLPDFAFGTAGAQPVTLSFWVNVSIAGTYSGALCNYLGTRAYPFLFAVPVGWTKVVVTIPGDTAGTWTLLGNGGSLYVCFDLGCGANYRGPAGAWGNGGWNGANGAANIVATNGAYYQLTGVKLEIGTVATPYNRESVTKKVADCQRYFQVVFAIAGGYNTAGGQIYNSFSYQFMRAVPSVTFLNIAYTNVSGLGLGFSMNNSLYAVATVTGTGAGTVTYYAVLDAEL
jgi:hypothetical protein